MVILAVSIYRNIWHSLTEKPVKIGLFFLWDLGLESKFIKTWFTLFILKQQTKLYSTLYRHPSKKDYQINRGSVTGKKKKHKGRNIIYILPKSQRPSFALYNESIAKKDMSIWWEDGENKRRGRISKSIYHVTNR